MTVLTNRTVNKDIKEEIKLYRQKFSCYFEIFWYFTIFIFQHNWKEKRLLVKKQGRIQLFKEVSLSISKAGAPKLASTNVSDQKNSMWIKYLIVF